MILHTWGNVTEDKVEFEQVGLRSWRKAIEAFTWKIDKKFFGIGFGLSTQVIYGKEEVVGIQSEWRTISQAAVTITRRWAWGRQHDYYDGCLCSFSLGFLHFNWEPDFCKKCYLQGHNELPACIGGKCKVKK